MEMSIKREVRQIGGLIDRLVMSLFEHQVWGCIGDEIEGEERARLIRMMVRQGSEEELVKGRRPGGRAAWIVACRGRGGERNRTRARGRRVGP
jgi:hypothetical protein